MTTKSEIDTAARQLVDMHIDILLAAAERFGDLDRGLEALIILSK